jgi:hypothetical protein
MEMRKMKQKNKAGRGEEQRSNRRRRRKEYFWQKVNVNLSCTFVICLIKITSERNSGRVYMGTFSE